MVRRIDLILAASLTLLPVRAGATPLDLVFDLSTNDSWVLDASPQIDGEPTPGAVAHLNQPTSLEDIAVEISSDRLTATFQSPFRGALIGGPFQRVGSFDLGFSGTLPFTLEVNEYTAVAELGAVALAIDGGFSGTASYEVHIEGSILWGNEVIPFANTATQPVSFSGDFDVVNSIVFLILETFDEDVPFGPFVVDLPDPAALDLSLSLQGRTGRTTATAPEPSQAVLLVFAFLAIRRAILRG